MITGSEFQVLYAFLDVYWTIFLNTLALPRYTSTYFEDILTQHIKPEILERLEHASLLKLNLLYTSQNIAFHILVKMISKRI